MFSYKWDNYPLQIKTSAESVWIRGNIDYGSSPLPTHRDMSEVLSLYWQFSDNSIWLAYHHTGKGQEFFSNLPAESEKTWTLFKLKRKLVIECNAVKVWEIAYKNLYDTQSTTQRSMVVWSKTATEIKFHSDTASNEYRSAGQ